jgi:hypothetical protein
MDVIDSCGDQGWWRDPANVSMRFHQRLAPANAWFRS